MEPSTQSFLDKLRSHAGQLGAHATVYCALALQQSGKNSNDRAAGRSPGPSLSRVMSVMCEVGSQGRARHPDDMFIAWLRDMHSLLSSFSEPETLN